MKYAGTLDEKVLELLLDLDKDLKEINVERINSTMLLKGLLLADDSPLYNAILEQAIDMSFFRYMVEETYDYVNIPDLFAEGDDEAEEVKKEEKDTKTYPQITIVAGKKKTTFFFETELADFLGYVLHYMEQGKKIDLWMFTMIFVNTMSSDVRTIFRTYSIRTELLREYFSEEYEKPQNDTQSPTVESVATSSIPRELSSCLRNLNEEFKGKNCDISGRDKECKQVWQTMMKKTKKNVVLVGEPGVGKTSIVVKIVYDILNGTCPEDFKNATVLQLDVTSIIAGTMYRGQAEQRFSALVDYLNNQPNIILFIDEMHTINGAGACKEGEIDLANALKPILAGDVIRVIGATTRYEYDNYVARDGALKRRFRPVYVKEPKMSEVYPMLKKSIESLSAYHGISITKEMVDFIVINAACFNNETNNPDRTKDLIDLAMVTAKIEGKTQVDKESVLSNFDYHFKQFAKMNERAKRSIAYHEAGHCLLAICSKQLKNYDVVAVSIMPTDTYWGITVFESNDVTPDPTREYYIDSIAMDLAGRVAEEMFVRSYNSGASADLLTATQKAYDIVSKYGMAEYGKNRIYSSETTSEKVKDRVNEEIDKIIGEAKRRAEEIISIYRDELIALVDALMQKGIVGPDELKEIFKDVAERT